MMTLRSAADFVGAELDGDGSGWVVAGSLPGTGGPGQVTWWDGKTGTNWLWNLHGPVGVIVPADHFGQRPPHVTFLRVEDPKFAFEQLMERLSRICERDIEAGGVVHPTAVVDPTAVVAAGSVVGAHCRIDSGVVVHSHVTLEAGVTLGSGTIVAPGSTIHRGSRLGRRCVVHSGAIIGSAASGIDDDGGRLRRSTHHGTTVLGDDVDVGSNTVIERGHVGATRISDRVKIGSLVMVGHDCDVGSDTQLVAQVGLASNVRIGRQSLLMGQVGVRAGVTIGDHVVVFGKSGVVGDLPGGAQYLGYPARPHGDALRRMAVGSIVRRLQRRVEAMEDATNPY